MKWQWSFLCAAALALSACTAPAAFAPPDAAEDSSAAASDALYTNSHILSLEEAGDSDSVRGSLESVQWTLENFGGQSIRYTNLAGDVGEESLGESLGTLRLQNASFELGGENILPGGAQALIEWDVANDALRVELTDSAGQTLLSLRCADSETQLVSASLSVTQEECESLAWSAQEMIYLRYAVTGSRAPFTVHPVAADTAGDAMTDEEAEQTVRAVCKAASQMLVWQRSTGYTLRDCTAQGIVMRNEYYDTLFLPSLCFDTAQAYYDALDSVLLRSEPEPVEGSAYIAWDGRLWASADGPGIGGSAAIRPEEVTIVSKEAQRIVADISQKYNDIAVSAVPLTRTRYEIVVQDGNWVLGSSQVDRESDDLAAQTWQIWSDEHYASRGSVERELDTQEIDALWDTLGAGSGSWRGTETGEWNEGGTLAQPEFAFVKQDGQYAFLLYSSLGSGATEFLVDRVELDTSGNYVLTVSGIVRDDGTEGAYPENARPALYILTGEEGDGLIEISGERMIMIDGWKYEYEFVPAKGG